MECLTSRYDLFGGNPCTPKLVVPKIHGAQKIEIYHIREIVGNNGDRTHNPLSHKWRPNNFSHYDHYALDGFQFNKL